ncbi:MAG: carboxylesterase/lipase family protein, partial [Candidatus Hodarchaeales archaeon]
MNKTEIISTTSGKLRGYKENGLEIFKGIPYAQPPIGDLRFSDTVEKEPWDGILKALEYGPIAPQTLLSDSDLFSHPKSEDCLTLNIWTTACDNNKRPVMFWIHGGAFIFGGAPSPRFNGKFLSQRGDICVVTINYRLGVLGNLFVPDKVSNLGFLDQITALKWVQDNIAEFGGNPANITLFGESAGSQSICTLLSMPAARGLFQRAICESGSPTPQGHQPESGIHSAELLFSNLGIKMGDIDALREMPFEKLIEIDRKTRMEKMEKRDFSGYPPIIDGIRVPEHPFITIGEGLSKDVDLIVGNNLDEATYFMVPNPQMQEFSWDDLQTGVTLLLSRYNLEKNKTEKLINFFKKSKDDPFDVMSAITTELGTRYNARKVVEAQLNHSRNVYMYLFTYRTSVQGGRYGATHALEIPFVFGTLGDEPYRVYPKRDEINSKISEKMMDSWISFAKTGNPNHDGIPKWPTYDIKNRYKILFGNET